MNPIFEHEGWYIFQIDDDGEAFWIGAKTSADALMLYLEDVVGSDYEAGEITVRAIRRKAAMGEVLDDEGKGIDTMANMLIEEVLKNKAGSKAFYIAGTVW